ncbi:DUF5776 domain-containing protein, partial [Enterococcus mundtii]|uniref:DUF5776 domain-containing protein n=1 Tax=Enterococcus mundtii TaxID=53346 RepID=UPI000A8680B4
YYYKDLSFTQRGEVVLKDTVVEITGIEYTNEGVPRLKTNKGYLTANKTYVQQLTANIENYYMSNPGKVALKHNDYYYKDLSFTQRGE